MNRAVEILKILRNGMESMLGDRESVSISYMRIFNFNEKRVSLRMEASENGAPPVPMGRIDVSEIPTNNGRVTCNCLLTELAGGKSERVILRLKNQQQREQECEKVFGFFRKILAIPEVKPLDGGFSGSSRGAHHQAPNPSE
jgi:hypothetical protein